MEPYRLLKIGGVYRTLHEYCGHDDVKWAEIIRSSAIIRPITRDILHFKQLAHPHLCYVGTTRCGVTDGLGVEKEGGKTMDVKVEFIDVRGNLSRTDDLIHQVTVDVQDCPHLYTLQRLITQRLERQLYVSTLAITICRYGYLEVFKLLVKLFPQVDTYMPYLRDEVFGVACKHGHLRLAKWLIQTYPNIDPKNNYCYAFRHACGDGHLHVVGWLSRLLPRINPRVKSNNAFRYACANGHLHLAQWLIRTYPVIEYDMYNNVSVFQRACENGHLHIIKWWVRTFPDINPRADDDAAFRMACRNGHLPVVLWLIERFPDIGRRSDNSCIFRIACENGHLRVAQLLARAFRDIDFQAHDEAFRRTCANGHLHVCKWLIRNFPHINHRSCDDEAFRSACLYNHLPVVKWLFRAFSDNDYNINDPSLYWCCENNNRVIKWLVRALHGVYGREIKNMVDASQNIKMAENLY